jgi:hypothetical protein
MPLTGMPVPSACATPFSPGETEKSSSLPTFWTQRQTVERRKDAPKVRAKTSPTRKEVSAPQSAN